MNHQPYFPTATIFSTATIARRQCVAHRPHGKTLLRRALWRIHRALPTILVSLLTLVWITSINAATLDEQIAAFKNANSTPTESSATLLLSTAVAEHRSAEAMAVVQSWLNRNHLQSNQAIIATAEAAENAGQWETAVGFYQRLLQSKGVDAKSAGDAVDATYRLLLNSIQDDNAAYLFMRKDGNRLRRYGPAKKYDRWFVDQAKTRRDLVAFCDRMVEIVNDRTITQERFDVDLQWFCDELELFKKESPEVYEAALRLATANAPAIIKARLRWAATVMPYNQQLDELRNASAPADPALTDAPLAAAAALIKAAPDRGPFLVAQGWGVEYDHQHSGNCVKRFEIEGGRKIAQLLSALPRMSDQARGEMLAFPIAQDRVKFEPAAIRKVVIDHPGMLNSLAAADVPLFDKTLTVEEAKRLAPQLARNPHLQAAMVRAWANPERKYSVAADQMMQSEMWRFTDVKTITHSLWHSGMFEREVDHDAPNKKHANLDARYQQLKKQIRKEASSSERMSAFNAIEKELLASNPTVPGVLPLWDELFANATDADKVSMISALVKNLTGDREYLLKRALDKVRFGAKENGAMPWQAVIHDNHFRYHQRDTRAASDAFLPQIAAQLRAESKSGAFSEIVFGIWLHLTPRDDPAAQALILELIKSPAYAKLDPAYRRVAADRFHFGHIAVTGVAAITNPYYVSRELLALPENAAPAQVEAALRTVIDRAAKAPTPVPVFGLEPVIKLPQWSASTRTALLSLFQERAPIGAYPIRQGYEALVIRIAKETEANKQWGGLEPYAAGLWQVAATKDDPRSSGANALAELADSALEDGAASIAATFSRAALRGPAGRKLFLQRDWDIPKIANQVRATSGKASLAIGVIDIPVAEGHPYYPLYRSQAEFALGNVDAAWELFLNNADLLIAAPQQNTDADDQPLIRKMTVGYCLWLLERNLAERDTQRAEALVKELMIWSRRDAGSFTPQQEAGLKIAYADTAFQKGNYQTARAWYRRVADAAEHEGSELQYVSALRSVKVDRVSRNFGSALTELDQLMQIRDDNLRTRVHYAKAEVLFDQENYAEAFEEVTAVLKSEPNHADGLILLGKSQLEMRKLLDAKEIELGATRDQGVIVPGETVKINLSDPSLNVAGVGADIEVEIWAESGDRERVLLYQLGDDKSKYRAEVSTQLGPPQPGDKVLQVLGVDQIRYGYSKDFRAKMTDLPPDPTTAIGIASNARLDVSAGAFPARKGERQLDLAELGISTAQQSLGARNVRPGNPIYVRVFDPDQSSTADVDEIVVAISTSSGDLISQLRLQETGTHTGEFEAVIPTGAAEAIAFASESAPSRDANMVISAEPYPGWAGKVGSQATERVLGVDLNDDVAVGQMVVRCLEPTLAPTHFVLQTSMNGRVWSTRARFPEDPAPGDGRPTFCSFPTYRNGFSVTTPKGRELPIDWSHKMELLSASESCNYLAAHVPNLSAEELPVVNTGHPSYPGLVRYRAQFYQPTAAIRIFQLAGLPADKNTSTVFLIDGQPAAIDQEDPRIIEREFQPGLHEIQVWRNESRADFLKRKPQLLCNVEGESELVACPDNMFDPATFPPEVRKTIRQPAVINASEAGDEFTVDFAKNAQARMIRLVIVGHEGTAPAIHKITLTDRAGEQILPVKTDYQQLRNNHQLEVIPGDEISVRYEDRRVIAQASKPGRTVARHEGRLGVAYNSATVSASFLNFRLNSQGERKQVLEDIRRFKMDDPVAIVINDPDMDVSPDRDVVQFSVTTGDKPPTPFIALETEPHSGVFLGRVFPVSTAPSRDSEIQVAEGGLLTATYHDAENLDPGIPTDRQVKIEHARYASPRLAAYESSGTPIPHLSVEKANEDDDENGAEIIRPRATLHYKYVDPDTLQAKPTQALIGAKLRFDVVIPHLAFANSSTITAYVQTDAGRKANQGGDSGLPFDVRAPGTLKLTGAISGATASRSKANSVQAPAGYVLGKTAKPPTSVPPLDEGRFSFVTPLILGDLPSRSYATSAADSLPASQIPDGLAVRAGDTVHIGFAFEDQQGNPQWLTAKATLTSDAFLDVMNGRYRREVSSAFVGEKLYVRLIAPGLDQAPGRDVTTVRLKTASGADTSFELRETEVHSGHFKGSIALTYADQPIEDQPASIEIHGLPVKYGDQIEVAFRSVDSRAVAVNKGADGLIAPFSKQYSEDGMAVRTTFTLAECFFELAKHHRKLNQESLARREMSHAQKLLAEAVASHQDEELKAHAEYLLGNLAQEYADLSKNEASKQLMYRDALARFSKIPLEYPDTEFAPQAQFKKALVYEKLGELDIAVEEYVKLAYKYPDHELIPSVMSRLGAYFQQQGLNYKNQAVDLEKKEDDVEAAGEAIRLRELATKEYLNAATVFGKLHSRFPEDDLAGLAGLRSAMNYMRASDYQTAIDVFQLVIDNDSFDGREVRSQALYWSGLSQERLGKTTEAYQIYRRTTFDFPDSIWAKRSRGRLADPSFAKIIELEEEAREQLLESFKKQR